MQKICRVLIVNEDQNASLYVASLLSKMVGKPYKLLRCHSVDHAITGISRDACDLVLLNYYWGSTAVAEKVLRWVKSRKPQIPVVVFTKRYERNVDRTVIKAGAVDYLVLNATNTPSLEKTLRYAVERKTDFGYINYLTHHDYLTSLPNRVLFKQRLQNVIKIAERDSTQFALLLVDINNFKEINHIYGLDAGDQLLKYFATQLSKVVGKQGNVSRIGSDEFAIILNSVERVDRVQIVAQKILDALDDRVNLNGVSLINYFSIGVATFPSKGKNPDQLQRNAELALAQAQRSKVSSYQFYASNVDHADDTYSELQAEFIEALANNEVGLYFNPRIDCTSDAIIGIEVNPYWSHPVKGLLEYEEFLWSGLKNDIAARFTEWLLATSFEYFQKLKVNTVTKLIFNIEFKALSSKGFPQIIEKYLNTYKISGKKLAFDLTKVSPSDHDNVVEHCMKQLQSYGISFGVNNFAGAEQSLSYIKKLPVSVLKLGPEFINEIQNDNYDTLMTKALVDFAHSLGKQIMIEGLHSELPLDNIKMLGFDYYKSLFSVDALSLVKLQNVIQENTLEQTRQLASKVVNISDY